MSRVSATENKVKKKVNKPDRASRCAIFKETDRPTDQRTVPFIEMMHLKNEQKLREKHKTERRNNYKEAE